MRLAARIPAVLLGLFVVGCASTTVTFTPAPPQSSLCQLRGEPVSALVLWLPNWRIDQKDVALREAAADEGIRHFFQTSGCFAKYEVRRISADVSSQAAHAEDIQAKPQGAANHVLVIVVRELGPVVKLFSSAALIDGGTEVVLNISEYSNGSHNASRQFTVHWQNGGPGVVKGVATLPADLEAALVASLKPN